MPKPTKAKEQNVKKIIENLKLSFGELKPLECLEVRKVVLYGKDTKSQEEIYTLPPTFQIFHSYEELKKFLERQKEPEKFSVKTVVHISLSED